MNPETPQTDRIVLAIPAGEDWAPTAGAATMEYARILGLPEEEVQRICLAVEEAVAHSTGLGHGREGDGLEVALSRSSLGLRLSVRSRGLPLDDGLLPCFDPKRVQLDGELTGLPALLARGMVDQAFFLVSDDGVRDIVLLKSMPASEPITNWQTEGSILPDSEGNTLRAVRLAGLEDAEAISRLALVSHRALFFNEQIYYPAMVRELIASGEMISAVAEAENGTILAHGALRAPSPEARAWELTYGFASPVFQGKGSGYLIADFLLNEALKRGILAINALAVTHHVRSQRSALHIGLHESALLLAASPAARVWHQNSGDTPSRIANLALTGFLGPSPATRIFAPFRHQRMIEAIGQHLGATWILAPAGTNPSLENETCLTAFADVKEGWGEVKIAAYGPDVLSKVSARLQFFFSNGLAVVYLVLPLDDPNTPAASEAFEAYGWFFAGAGLNEDGRNLLILQQLNGVDPGYESIQVHTDFARDLLDYVRSCDPGIASARGDEVHPCPTSSL